jgi:hypothetical protein
MRVQLVAFICLITIIACGPRLRSDFERLPVERQVAAYKDHLARRGAPSRRARSALESGGHGAADALAAELLSGSNRSFEHEALVVISTIQSKGTDLRDSRAERVLQTIVSRDNADETSRNLAYSTLSAIREGYHASKPAPR